MTDGHDDDRRSAADGAFVRRIASEYAAPRRSAAEQVAFVAKLDARLERERWRRPAVAAGAVVAALAAVLLLRLAPAVETVRTIEPHAPLPNETAMIDTRTSGGKAAEGFLADDPRPRDADWATTLLAQDATPDSGVAQAEAILVLAIRPDPAPAEALPDDYEAIASVLLGG